MTLRALSSTAPSSAPISPTTTTVPGTTTTTTSTTVPPSTTTTTSPPSTTTSTRPHASTTTRPSTTTTTAPLAAGPTSANTPWALIGVVIGLALAILVLVVVLLVRRSRARASAWRRAVLPALSDARLARDALLSGNAESDDDAVRAAVALQVERAATAFERALDRAPEPDDEEAARVVASALRNLGFAVEADRLLRHGSRAPTGVQLAEADQARRDRTAELDRAVSRLAARVGGTQHPPR